VTTARALTDTDWIVQSVMPDSTSCPCPSCAQGPDERAAAYRRSAMAMHLPRGALFAYTIGLHEHHCLPELHLPAAPDVGQRRLSAMNLARILNRLGGMMVAGVIGPEDQETFTADAGTVVMVFTLGQPGSRERLQADQAHRRARVIPITWANAAQLSPFLSP
jgi:hypothetical protein